MKYFELNIQGYTGMTSNQFFRYRLTNMQVTQIFWYACKWEVSHGEIGPINSPILITLN